MSGMIPVEFRGLTAAAERTVEATYRSVQNWECSRKATDDGNGPQQHKTTGRQNEKSLPREEVRQAFQKEPINSWEEECC